MHVTVLMPVYNEAGVVQTAVESILSQTYKDWDLLIIDDGSTDGTSTLVQSIAEKDPRITVIRNAANRGISAALNQGWKQARGHLIARMDADDVSLPQRLERQVLFMESHPEVAVLGTGVQLVDGQGKILGVALPPEQHQELVHSMYRRTPFYHSSVMVRQSFYEAMNGYDERWRRSEDTDLWLRSYGHFRFHNLQEPLIRYRFSGRQTLREIAERTLMLAYAAYREGRLLTRGWYAVRFVALSLVLKTGLWKMRAHRLVLAK